MYLPENKVLAKLNITKTELLMHRAAGNILYSEKTDKYDIDSILQKRTLTIGLQKHLSSGQENDLLGLMQKFSSLKLKLFSGMQAGVEYKNSGTDREHRIMARALGLTNPIADSAFSSATGAYKSSQTWFDKTIEQLSKSISELNNKLAMPITKRQRVSYTRALKIREAKLLRHKKLGHLKVWFGKSFLSGDKQDLLAYRKKRMEFFVEGSTSDKGNSQIRIESTRDGRYQLKLFNNVLPNIKIPRSHRDTFTLDNFNRQACRIAFNSKGRFVLHITYSYIKPLVLNQDRGCVGIDIGPNEIAVCYVKKDGNPESYKHYSIGNLKDKRSPQTQKEISMVLDRVLNDAAELGYSKITIEDLNLPVKDHGDKKLNRLLSKFPREVFKGLIVSKCARRGFKLKMINPAFTSIIGLFKYSYRDNLSDAHHAKSKDLSAALVIGRRRLGFQERAVVSVRGLIQGSIDIRSLIRLPEDKRKKADVRNSNWSLWKELARNYSSCKTLTACLNAKSRTGTESLSCRPVA